MWGGREQYHLSFVFWALQSWFHRCLCSHPFWGFSGSGVCWAGSQLCPLLDFIYLQSHLLLVLCYPGPEFCCYLLFFSPYCCGLYILKKSFCFGFSGASGQSEIRSCLVHRFTLEVRVHLIMRQTHKEATRHDLIFTSHRAKNAAVEEEIDRYIG